MDISLLNEIVLLFNEVITLDEFNSLKLPPIIFIFFSVSSRLRLLREYLFISILI